MFVAAKKSSYYQSRYRARLREQGYVKREVWIPSEYTNILKNCETALRSGVIPIVPKTVTERKMSQEDAWTTESLFEALGQSESGQDGNFEVELIEGAEPNLLITMLEFGDLPVLVSVSGSQIIVDTMLWAVDEVDDVAAFNTMILKTHKVLPLSTFGIQTGPDGRDYYELFGSLSASSTLESVIVEIETVADNAMQAAEAYNSDLKNVA